MVDYSSVKKLPMMQPPAKPKLAGVIKSVLCLHPYQMVKDLRTSVEKGNAQGVLDGDLDDFIAASLASRVGNQR